MQLSNSNLHLYKKNTNMYKLKTYSVILSIFLVVHSNLFSQIVREYKLTGFEKVSIGSAIHVKINQSGNFKVISKGKKEDLEELDVFVSNKTLIVESKSKWSLWNHRQRGRIEFIIEMPTVNSLNFSGATQSIVTGFDDLHHLDIDLSGASKSKVEVFVSHIQADVSGASQLQLVGRANKLEFSMSGASNINAENFPTKTANIDASGASKVKLSVSDFLTADASGAAHIDYHGNPKIKKSTSGGASLRQISR